jgi:ATP-dependent RNA helicase DDX31/DBP7
MHVYRLHGTIDQEERTAALAAFCAAGPLGGSSISSVLVCTDVAARGLNLPHVDWIVQYDPPSELSDYIHRIGRTARSGQSGCSLLFVLPSERSYIELLHAKQSGAAKKLSGGGSTAEKAVESAVALIQPLSLGSLLDELRVLSGVKVKPSKRGRGGGGGDDAARATSMAIARMQRALFATIEGDATLRELAVSAYLSWVLAYTTHSRGTKHIFTLRAVHLGHIARSFALKDQPKSAEEKVREEKAVAEAAMKARAAALSVEGQEAVAAAFFSNMGQRAATSVADSSSRTDHSKRLSLAPREENDKGISEKRSAHRWEAHDEFAM